MNMLQFNPAANLPMSVLRSALGDIKNFMAVFLSMLLGLSTVGFLIFGTEVENFRTFHASMLSIFLMIAGRSNIAEIFEIHPFLSTYFIFLVSEIVKHILFWILLGIFFDHFSREYQIY